MKRKRIKSIVAWGVIDADRKLCEGWLYATKKLCLQDLEGNPYGLRPIKVRVSVYRKRKKASDR